MALKHQQTIQQIKDEAARLTQKRLAEAQEAIEAAEEADRTEKQEATNKTKPVKQ